MDTASLALIPLWYVAFLFSTVCHEAAHALVAKWGGDPTAYAAGQVTLDPLPHIKREPFGMVLVPLITMLSSLGGSMFGWGSAPYNPYWQIRYPRRAALMALAGPLTNLTLALLSAFSIYLGVQLQIFSPPFSPQITALIVPNSSSEILSGCASLLSIMLVLNVILTCFNLLPLPPLDGFAVLGLFLPEDLFLRGLMLTRTTGISIFGGLVAFYLFPHLVQPILAFVIGHFYRQLL
jgi:Zn-dependent protease